MNTDPTLHTTPPQLGGGDLFVDVWIAAPLPNPFTYRWGCDVPPVRGQRVVVPWGRQTRIGLVQGVCDPDRGADSGSIKSVLACLDDGACLSAAWWQLIEFAARYYHHPMGMIALEALPKALRVLNAKGAEPVMVAKARAHALALPSDLADQPAPPAPPALNEGQRMALQAIEQATGFAPHLLYGITGSGKTEVYLNAVAHRLARGQQVLVLLPEINLTPAAQRLYEERLAPHRVVVLHSNLPELARTKAWYAAAMGKADVVIGTRLGVLTPLPRLGLVVVDEEHDPSYKQQDGMRYNARDLALMLAKQRDVPVVLGSATPALESWLK
ncbi:MAG TPA: DEAD/DEAH box helicase, partial [Limnobacter sp.]|nr:DEAD/DEAH box helicase [Limnobacter sp.]